MLTDNLQTTRIEISSIRPDQAQSFHRALDCVARERRFLTFLEAPSLEETRSFILSGIKKGDPRIVACHDGKVVGWCDIGRHYFPTRAHRGSLGMGIVVGYRGKGLGFRLIQSAIQAAWIADFTRIELAVYEDNMSAIRLYEKVGFKREGVVRDAIRVDGTYRDAIAMALLASD